MDPVGSSAGGLASGLAGVGTQSGTKKKTCIESVYTHSPSYKKVKKLDDSGIVVNLSAGFFEELSVNRTFDVKNMRNMIVEETSYVNSDTSRDDKLIDNAMPKNLKTKTYVFEHLSKQPFFVDMGGADNLPPVVSCDREIWSFISVKSFALDIKLSAVSGKTVGNKLICIIRLFFISEMSLNKAKELAISKKILVNDDLRRVNIHSDWVVIVKKIPVNLPKSAIETVFSKFGAVKLVRMQLIGLWQKALVEFESAEVANQVAFKWFVLVGKNSVHVALAVENKQMWVLRDQHRTLLYTLSVGTTAYNLSGLLESYDGKTCFIGRNPSLYVHDQCAVICFKNEASKLAAVGLIPVFKSVNLRLAGFCLAYCTQYTQFGHITANCSVMVSDQDCVCLAVIYKKKSAPVSHPALFGGRTWVSVVGAPSGVSSHRQVLSSGFIDNNKPLPLVVNDLEKWLVSIESSLVSFTGQFGELAKRLESFVPAVPQLSPEWKNIVIEVGSGESTCDETVAATVTATYTVKNSSMFPHVVKLENMLEDFAASVLSLSAYFDSLALAADEQLCEIDRFAGVRVFTSGLDFGHMGSGVAIIIDSSLMKHVCKVLEVPGRLLLVKLLFRNRLSVSILGLYAGASLTVYFSQAKEINFLIVRAVNESSFVIFGGDFNENGSHKCTSFKKCFDLGLYNFYGVAKTINYVFFSYNLINAIMNCGMLNVDDFFDTDYKAVFVSVGLGGLLDIRLSSICKQANKNCWKFDVKDMNELKWAEFRDGTAANVSMFSDVFVAAGKFLDLDAMWDIIRKIMILSANGTFKKKWFKDFDSVFNKVFSRFHKLELLVSKLVKAFRLTSRESGFDDIRSKLAKARKSYCFSKMLESKCAKESHIRQAIKSRMESFELNKSHTIRSVLKYSFHKIVLDYLVVDDKLVLEPELVKSKVDGIMEG
ncbi:hypothetical protein G9A89_014514 [Geosiphon pyriformis]|nr:hypothetical protein G9A89_014514 [Geosiphon pyriformis]